MKHLLAGIVDFRKKLTEENRQLFAQLALGQKPDALFIACCDSRVVPNLFASTNPGDLFVLRNMGNLIPPPSAEGGDNSAQAALEFSVLTLKVSDIILCGHSECGAMQALQSQASAPHLAAWLKYANPSVTRKSPNPALSPHNQLSQANVLQQLDHIKSYPFIQERLKNKTLRLHGWWFDIARADVYCYEEAMQRFVLIDEAEAKLILSRLG